MSHDVLSARDSHLAAPVKPKRSRRRAILLLGLIAIAMAVSSYGWRWWTVGRFLESTDDAYVGGEVTPIAPRVAGLIARVLVTDNQVVRAGEVLVQLDDRDYRATLARSEALIAEDEAKLANADARDRLQRAAIQQAEAETVATDAEVERTRADQARYRQLSATSAASAQSFQRADADAKKALAADRRAHVSVAAATLQLGVIATERRQTEAALAQHRADRDVAALNLSDTQIRSPVDGTVGNRGARAGAFATAGAQLLAIVPARGLWVDANFKETQLAAMRPGMAARIEADAAPGRVFTGRVGSLSPATGAQFSIIPAENATGNFTKIVQRVPVRILLDGEAGTFGTLRPGLSVRAEIDHRQDAARP